MNPLLFKAHPLLMQWLDVLLNPGAQHPGGLLRLLAILLCANLLWAAGLPWLLRKTEGLALTPLKAYLAALPATFLYSPLMLTLLQDVIGHAFTFSNRWFLLFALLVASQFLTALYAYTLRHERSGAAIGLESGLTVALFLLLAAIPASLILMGLDALLPFF